MLFTVPLEIRCIIWRRARFLNVRECLATKLMSRRHSVIYYFGRVVQIPIGTDKIIRLNRTSLQVVRLDKCTLWLGVIGCVVSVHIAEFHECGWWYSPDNELVQIT